MIEIFSILLYLGSWEANAEEFGSRARVTQAGSENLYPQ